MMSNWTTYILNPDNSRNILIHNIGRAFILQIETCVGFIFWQNQLSQQGQMVIEKASEADELSYLYLTGTIAKEEDFFTFWGVGWPARGGLDGGQLAKRGKMGKRAAGAQTALHRRCIWRLSSREKFDPPTNYLGMRVALVRPKNYL